MAVRIWTSSFTTAIHLSLASTFCTELRGEGEKWVLVWSSSETHLFHPHPLFIFIKIIGQIVMLFRCCSRRQDVCGDEWGEGSRERGGWREMERQKEAVDDPRRAIARMGVHM